MVASNYYAILGITSTATEDEIRKAYRKKALQYHPDKNSSTTAEEIFKQINKAYEILSDTEKRRTYDLQQQQPTNNTKSSSSSSSSSQQYKHEPSFQSHFSSRNNSHSSRFRFHDPFFDIHQRHAYFASKFHSPNFSFFDTNFGLSDADDDNNDNDNETDYDHFDSNPSTFHSSQRRFRRKHRSKWNHNWPFDNDPFMMFDMLTRSVFDQFLTDDQFWRHSTARLRSSSQQQHRTTSTNRTKIPVNHVTPSSSKYRNDIRRPTSTSRFNSKDSDEENLEENFVFQQSKPTSTTNHRFRKRTMDNSSSKQKLETCQYCFYTLTSMENLLKHESNCRHRPPEQEQTYTTKCSYCHQNIRLNEYLEHEELCKQFEIKRQASEKKYSYNQSHPKSSSGGLSSDIDQLRTCNRCHRIFPVLSDLFNHLCDDENDLLSSKSDKNNINTTSLIDQISSTSPKSFKLARQTLSNKTPISSSSSPIHKLISPLSRTNTPINDSQSSSSLEPEHIPTFKRPLFHLNEQQQQHSSNNYINLRNPTSIHVNS